MSRHPHLVTTLTVASVLLALTIGAAHATELTIEIRGVASDKGDINVALYDGAATWMKKQVKGSKIAAKKEGVSLTINDVQPGEYAISMFHDENGNGKMDRNAFGIPIEPYAFSNDATGSFGPPNFEQAKFKVEGDKKSIVINFK